MRSRERKKWVRLILALALVVFALLPASVSRAAGSLLDSPYVVPYYYVDPETGEVQCYFTIDQPQPIDYNRGETEYVPHHYYKTYYATGTNPSFWLPEGTTVTTGIASSLRALNVGEHYYHVERTGEIPIGKWVVEWPSGKCIHDDTQDKEWKGLIVNNTKDGRGCRSAYYSGWMCYCADCGELLNNCYIYAPQDRIETIDYMNVDYGYYYVCQNPNCRNLENEGYVQPHQCRAISPNRYVVVYNKNGAVPIGGGEYGDVDGTMLNSYHMYGNATEYEGKPVEPVTHLTKNCYQRDNYTFVGWNTQPDGSGTPYADGQEILNLTEYNFEDIDHNPDPRGFVTLYAQWVPTESTLRIDPVDGKYDGRTGVTDVRQGYGTKYLADPDKVTPKSIHKVSYETNGGNSISPTDVPRKFTSWRQEPPFKGKMRENTYYFMAENNNVDVLTALYENLEITLPTPIRPGWSFGGWFEDPECTSKPVGFGGDPYLALDNVTLYAKWSQLTLWSKNNYIANSRKGAADLWWSQPDSAVKTYKLYKSPDAATWTQIEGTGGGSVTSVSKDYAYNGTTQTYQIPSTGFYELEAFGAQGGSYSDKTGGKGGSVTTKFYFKKGDVLRITIGGEGGFGGGGAATTYAVGGGATTVTLNGEVILVAGGGGGATEFDDGQAGGLETALRTDGIASGENGLAGGGGGYAGGKAGTVERHYHSDECKVEHVHGPGCYTEQKVEKICTLTPIGYQATEQYTSHYCDEKHEDCAWRYWHYYAYHSACGLGTDGYGYCPNDDYGTYFTHGGEYRCDACGRTYCNGDQYSAPGYTGEVPWHKFYVKEQKLVCTQITGSGCKHGWSDGQVLSHSAAYGGSSFVSPNAISGTTSAGVREHNGKFSIRSAGIGLSDEEKLDGVPANDLAAPDAIVTYEKNPITSVIVEVLWDEPEDNGTPYWFRAESYNALTGDKMCDSNVVKNVLVTGVAGYYYKFDQTPAMTLTASNATNAGHPYEDRRLQCTLTADVHYLHLAPVDVAGNVGPTTDIKLDRNGDISWAVKTQQVDLSKYDSRQDNVYVDGSGTIFVRADGRTPFKLSFDSYIDGRATDDYQITEQNFYLSFDAAGDTYEFKTLVPSETGIQTRSGSTTLPVSEFVRRGSGSETILLDASLTGASRRSYGMNNSFWQAFTAPASISGKTVVATPGAAAGEDDNYRHSAWDEDVLNAISFIPDGEAPDINANQDFASLTVINADTIADGAIRFNAADALSGLGSLEVKVINQDNGLTHVFKDTDADGVVEFTYDATSALFDGDVTFEVTAIDNVGNVNLAIYGKAEYTMTAEILHAGYNPSGVTTYRRGDLALLHVVTTGYADTIRIQVPAEIAPGYPADGYDFYGLVDYRTNLNINFVVPYDCPAGIYEFIVHSYKNGVELEARPVMITIVDDPIGSDVRVRIR